MAGPAYSPLLKGGYVSQDKLDAAEFGHPGTPARLAALREVAKDAGATVTSPSTPTSTSRTLLHWPASTRTPLPTGSAPATDGTS